MNYFPNPFDGLTDDEAAEYIKKREKVHPFAYRLYGERIRQVVAKNIGNLEIPEWGDNHLSPEEEFSQFLYDGVMDLLISGSDEEAIEQMITARTREAFEIFGK